MLWTDGILRACLLVLPQTIFLRAASAERERWVASLEYALLAEKARTEQRQARNTGGSPAASVSGPQLKASAAASSKR